MGSSEQVQERWQGNREGNGEKEMERRKWREGKGEEEWRQKSKTARLSPGLYGAV
jgi:hypothetical protein